MTYNLWHFYDLQTGLLASRCYGGPEDQLAINTPNGHAPITGVADALSQRVDLATGELVAYRPPAPPDDAQRTWRWDQAARRWLPVPTLAALQAQAWTRIKAERDRQVALPKSTPAGPFDASPADQDNLNKVLALTALAAAAGLPAEARYTLADNSRVLLTLAQLQAAALSLGAQTQALYDTAAALRAQIDAATTPAELDAIQWPV